MGVTQRKPYDFYPTPTYSIESLFKNIDINQYGDRVLEPSAGNGNICKIIKERYPNKYITALEIRDEELESLSNCSDKVIIDDFIQKDMGGLLNTIL